MMKIDQATCADAPPETSIRRDRHSPIDVEHALNAHGLRARRRSDPSDAPARPDGTAPARPIRGIDLPAIPRPVSAPPPPVPMDKPELARRALRAYAGSRPLTEDAARSRALIGFVAHEIWKRYGGNDVLNWLEAEILLLDAAAELEASAADGHHNGSGGRHH